MAQLGGTADHVHPLRDHIAGFKYRDVIYCRKCLPPEVMEEARTFGGEYPHAHVEGQFFPRSEMKGTGWKCDLCDRHLSRS